MKKKTAPKKAQVKISLQLDKNVIEGTGDTVLAALRAVQKPVKITTKSVLTIEKDGKKHSRPLTIPLAKRLFYPASQLYWAKNFELLLK